ncbi:HAMP domain-containing sensor histidine kinase [Paenibacillus sp. NEAU-GSW1]|uniref:sensor histidine kinase n=1 Tax=Paenibacillus sp. NEAU-GSW1 TaxID=2682486 RepID=UPI0012E164CD|nr:histidine kinase [Paenibacillus sp. NEAU-GSW1]
MATASMLVYFFALLAAAFVLLFNNPRSETNRWAVLFLAAASIGGLADTLSVAGFNGASNTVQLLNHIVTPYAILIFAILYSETAVSKRAKIALKLLLLLPVLTTAIIVLLSSSAFAVPYKFLLAWAAPYYLATCGLLIRSLWKETDRRNRKSRLIVTVIIVPTVLAVLVFINIANAFIPNFDFFRYISFFIIYSLTIALLGSFAYGVLGVKLRFEHDPLESAMKTASSGTSLLNHSIKNEIGKIAISSENLKQTLGDREDSMTHLQIIAKASDHLLHMTERMHSQLKTLTLVEEPCRLDQLIEQCLLQHKPLLEQSNISVSVQFSVRPTLLCDPVHLQEAIGNVLMNAKEAMPDGGMLDVRLEHTKREIRLTIQDTGEGIAEGSLAHVFEPFFSTKNRDGNFGLGLSYVYNVMRKSGGAIELVSVPRAGTIATFRFPAKKAEEGLS